MATAEEMVTQLRELMSTEWPEDIRIPGGLPDRMWTLLSQQPKPSDSVPVAHTSEIIEDMEVLFSGEWVGVKEVVKTKDGVDIVLDKDGWIPAPGLYAVRPKQSPPPKPRLEETIDSALTDLGHSYGIDFAQNIAHALIRDGHVKGEDQ